ncbi:MAG TPA: DUF2141 domain-containing protein [Terracidiphilus sp.]|nr:DUF2141 domain-containing protein [Terracidiphilus sp.]
MTSVRTLAILPILLLPISLRSGAQTGGPSESTTHPSAGCTLRIHVDGLRNSKGNIGTIVFTSAAGWPEDKNKALRVGPAPIDPGQRKGTAVWKDLPPGVYGVAAIHDENSNAKLDKNLIGIPKEGFGFANNPHVGWGPPPFSAALVHVACPVTEVAIHIQYK